MKDYKILFFSILFLIFVVSCEETENPLNQKEQTCEFNSLNGNAPFLNRHEHNSIYFDNKIWLIGGEQKIIGELPKVMSDVWYSEDGANWTLATENAGFEPALGSGVIIFDNKMWIFGIQKIDDEGNENTDLTLNDIWNSTDGITWNRIETNITNVFWSHNIILHNNRIFLLQGSFRNDLSSWYSDDGINWTEIELNDNFSFRTSSAFVSFNNRIWMIGGSGVEMGANGGAVLEWNDIWSSENGIVWEEANPSAEFSVRFGHAATIFENKIWISGGIGNDGQGSKSDVWSSSDGITWALECSEAFDKRLHHTMISSNNNIYVIGGSKPGPAYADVVSLK